MRRLAVLGALFLVAALAPPASAAPTYHAKYCNEVDSPNGQRGFNYCIAVMEGDGGFPQGVWVRMEFWDVNGKADPFYLDTSFTLESRTGSGSWCDGRYPSCSAIGEYHYTDPQPPSPLPTSYASAWTAGTEHYDNGEHLCKNRGFAAMRVRWYSSDPMSNVIVYTNVWDSYPNCTGF